MREPAARSPRTLSATGPGPRSPPVRASNHTPAVAWATSSNPGRPGAPPAPSRPAPRPTRARRASSYSGGRRTDHSSLPSVREAVGGLVTVDVHARGRGHRVAGGAVGGGGPDRVERSDGVDGDGRLERVVRGAIGTAPRGGPEAPAERGRQPGGDGTVRDRSHPGAQRDPPTCRYGPGPYRHGAWIAVEPRVNSGPLRVRRRGWRRGRRSARPAGGPGRRRRPARARRGWRRA